MPEVTIHTSILFDPKKKQFVKNISIKVNSETGLITKVIERDDTADPLPRTIPKDDIDLRGSYVLPGFVDAHTHIFLHSYEEADELKQKRDESLVERVIRATNHCRAALLAGYTTYRDLGSESMLDADANVRDAIARGITPGPRLFVATQIITSTGTFESRNENSLGGVRYPPGADAADGVDEIRKAVRRRIAAGADVIKLYADYSRRIMRYPPKQVHPYIPGGVHPPKDPNPATLAYSQEELDAVVAEAKRANCPVAAHCTTLEGAMMSIKAGVDSIEHGAVANDEMYRAMAAKGCILVPTLTILESLRKEKLPQYLTQTKRAYDLDVRLACGGDTGTFNHGENAREMELMVESGIPVEDVLEMCTVGGWEACGKDLCGRRFGWFEEGLQADLIALDTDPRVDKEALRKVSFVMKDGRVWKIDGLPVGMA